MTAKKTTLSSLATVVHGKGEFSSKLVSTVDLAPDALLAKIEGSTLVHDTAYSTVQISETHNIELNSDLLYSNHSCAPSVVFDTDRMEVRVLHERPLKAGEDITFFYPSTEWDMKQPFDCQCGSNTCLGSVKGARYMDEDVLRKYWLNKHIIRLLDVKNGNGHIGSTSKE